MTEALTKFSALTSRTGADVSIATRLYPLAAALAMGCTTAMQVGQAAGPTSAAITAPDLRTRLYIFADDSMMGRQFGTEGNLKATQYIANELARLGIQPRPLRLPVRHHSNAGPPQAAIPAHNSARPPYAGARGLAPPIRDRG